MSSFKDGDTVQFIAERGPEKGNMITGKVLRTKGCVGCFIEGLDGFDHGFVPLPQIQPFSDVSNPTHGGTEHRKCYLEVDGYAIYAVDIETGKEIAAVTINGGFQKAFQLIESAVAAKGCYRIV